MADAIARREARRKRILENSETRLQRITSGQRIGHEDVHPDLTQPKNDDLVKTYLEHQDYVTLTESLPNNLHRREGSSMDDIPALMNHIVQNETQNNTVTNKVTNVPNNDNKNASIKKVFQSADAGVLFSVFGNKWTLVLLAALVNILYLLQLQRFCGKDILVPFFTLVLVRLHLFENKAEMQGGNMLSAVLILCSVDPKLVRNLRWVMRICRKVVEEFSIYIFSFIVLHNVASLY
ncbi:uncharacterized protein LOC124298038 [Neodiprion virginianus]|uniref:uncharacterized protein LOC124298038 n=1 Tax=Neodiprion virginianus TaxID=2961670 RepID=UPI001EE6A4CA|nr:uncharacterized protein LOC124298038 [Neodiprion virginianus]